MIETLATCLCKQMLFCYLTNESLRHQRRQEKDNFLYTADPGAPLTYFNDGGGSDRGSYFISKKIPTSEFVYPKKSLLFLAYPKKSLSVFASANFIIYLLES